MSTLYRSLCVCSDAIGHGWYGYNSILTHIKYAKQNIKQPRKRLNCGSFELIYFRSTPFWLFSLSLCPSLSPPPFLLSLSLLNWDFLAFRIKAGLVWLCCVCFCFCKPNTSNFYSIHSLHQWWLICAIFMDSWPCSKWSLLPMEWQCNRRSQHQTF